MPHDAGEYQLTPTTAIFSHQNGTNEQTIITFTSTQNTIFKGMWLDLVNLTQNTTIRISYEIDGQSFRNFQRLDWTIGDDDGVFISGKIPNRGDFRITTQSLIAEGAVRSIPYEFWRADLGVYTT